jgi:drug/metabolite transporter (DMT)-like permease
MYRLPILQALFAALLFGASAPLAKVLLGEVAPVPLAAFLYLGSGVGLLVVQAFQRLNKSARQREAQMSMGDFPWLLGAILAGGVAAPITLLFSLKNTPAATAALLLNFEGVATTLIAAFAFKESISPRVWWAIILITLASISLSVNFKAGWGFSPYALGIVAACILWGLDNNFTRNISAKDPLTIVTIKGLAAGAFSLGLAMFFGNPMPAAGVILGAMILGFMSYGLSIVLFIHAMRALGAARTSALFGTAPLAGMLISFLLFWEFPGWMFILALPLMIFGALFLVGEHHEHKHIHSLTIHDHAHIHLDEHHAHKHEGRDDEKHAHLHSHEQPAHSHDHMPDLHHRHDDPKEP